MTKKRKTRILATIIITVIFIIGWYIYLRSHDGSNTSLSEVNQIQFLLAEGDSLRGSNQDSCIAVYNRAIKMAQSLEQNKTAKHMAGLGYIGLAALNCNLGNYPESSDNVCFALKCADSFGDTDIRAQAINIKGLLCFNQSNFDSALVFYEQALLLAKDVDNSKLQGKIHTNFAIIKFYQGFCDEAIANFGSTLKIAEQLNDIDLITGTYINMGLVANHFGEYSKATGFFEKAIESYKKINGIDGLILCHQNLGTIWFLQGNYGKAFEEVKQSLILAEAIGDKSNIAKAHHNMAELYARVGDHQQAMEAYLISIRKKEELNDKAALIDGYNGLGALFYQKEQYDKALEYFNKALALSDELNLVKTKSTAYSSIAGIHVARHNYSEAVQYYQKALDLSMQTNNVSSIADHHINLGSTYTKLQQYERAYNLLDKALVEKTALNEKGGMANVYAELALLEYNRYQAVSSENKSQIITNAVKYGLKAFQLASEMNEILLVNSTSKLLKQIYTKTGNLQEALRFADKQISTTDSINRKANAEAVTYAEARWSVEKQESQIKNLENEKEIQERIIAQKELQSKQYKIITGFAILIIVLMVGFTISLVFFYRRKREAIYQHQLNDLTRLKMQNISSRISPHFVFNMLGSLSNAANNPEKVKEKISHLSLLLRNVIENVEHTTVPFNAEIEVVCAYIALQEEKISKPFHFQIDIDPDFDPDSLIPAMIVQIPVENAIKHGFMPLSEGPCILKIHARKTPEGNRITITDNGVGVSNITNRIPGTGTGLKMIMQTLLFMNAKNETKIKFSITDRKETSDEERGTIATVLIPFGFSF
jgi:tetratricopeptide (TPR) repeat protein